jgi:ATP-binding cassette, subfamily B, bacterial MsbA
MEFELYKRLWKSYISPYTKLFVIGILLSLAVSGLTGATAWLIKPALDNIFIQKDRSMLYVIPGIVVLVFALKGLFSYLQEYVMAYLGQTIIMNIRNDVYRKIIYLPVADYTRLTTGTLTTRVYYDVDVLQRIVAGSIKDTVQRIFTIISLLVVIFVRDWKLSLLAMLVLPGTGYIIARMGKKLKKLVSKQALITQDTFSFLNETLASPRVLKASRTEELEAGNFYKISDRMKTVLLKVTRVRALSTPLMELIGSFGIAAIILYGGYQVINGVTTPGNFFSFMAALMMFYAPIKSLSSASNNYHQAMVSAQRVFEILDMPNEEEQIHSIDKKKLAGVRESIEYRDVYFRYEGTEEDSLKGVSLRINSGEMVAFVGSSGAGKTTIVNLLPRFYDVTQGGIFIDGVDLRDYSLGSLRSNIGLVSQDVVLFNNTARYNIAYGMDSVTEEQIAAAAKSAFAHDFISKMQEGYGSVIGERGTKLSGGEKQRIAIARAILKNSPILILDEATSALDSESERMVQKALDNLMKGRTTLVIAHRLSTVRHADKIVVVEGGRIVEVGSHAELIQKGGNYRRLYEIQYSLQEKDVEKEGEQAVPAE